MHTRALTCRMCKNKFFPASLKFHTKVCAEKQDHIDLPCDYCQEKFPPTVLQTHMKTCTRDSKQRAQATRGMRRRYQDPRAGQGQRRVESNVFSAPPGRGGLSPRRKHIPVVTPLRARKKCSPLMCSSHSRDVKPGPQQPIGNESGPQQPINIEPGLHQPVDIESGPQQPIGIKQQPIDDGEHYCKFEEIGDVAVTSSDERVACSNCNRWFSPDRVAVHQEICQRVNTEENRERHTRRIMKGVGSNVRSTKQRPSFSASGYSASRRRRAQELLPGRALNQTRRAIDESERMVMAATYNAPRTTITGKGWRPASTKPTASTIRPVENMYTRRESGHHRWSQTENRRPSGISRAARRGVVQQRARPSTAVGWVSSTAKPAAGGRGGREASIARDVSSMRSPVRLGRGASVTVWSTRGVGRAARFSGGGGGGGDDGGHLSGGRRHCNSVRDVFSRRDVDVSETGDACGRAGTRWDMRPQTAFFAPPGARRKIPFS